MELSRVSLLLVPSVFWLACGGPPAASPPTAASAMPTTTAATPVASSSAPAVASVAPPAAKPGYADPNESAAPLIMAPLVAKGTPKSKFPKSTLGDKACWQEVGTVGEHEKDFETLLGKCGAPTGLLEYVKPVTGKLHHEHDRRDTYQVKLHGGLCYRIFAVSDSSIQDLDILITTTSNAIIGDDKVRGPIAIIHGDQPWCMDDDTEYQFHVEVDGPGTGGYSFGIWARPKK